MIGQWLFTPKMRIKGWKRKKQIPFVDSNTYVAYINEEGGVIESLKEDNIVNLDSEVQSLPEWVSTVALINSGLSDAMLYELWADSDGSAA
ncbi:mitochondrial outer membrane import complex protein METAXIN-like protein [Tanacetum coccineum]|uniref:Mitochondrial outer membrane import complex protein METAXIN-like protein n=1 Tax=Tanacetum coccineum TaxID=301880 RepID=A0ABQ5AH10_9ASTR